MREVKGKVAVVTGAGSGIGRALARLFAREGMKVALADIEAEGIEEVASEITGSGGTAIAVVTDVSVGSSVEALRDRTFQEFETAHLVCLNAGVVAGSGVPAWELPVSVFEWQMRVNFLGVVNGIQAFVPRLVEQREGHVVTTSSMAGVVPGMGSSSYSSSKYAITGISEAVRMELDAVGSPVKISVVVPGPTGDSRMIESLRLWPSELGEAPQSAPVANRIGLFPIPEIMKQAISSLMSPDEVATMVLDGVRDEQFWIVPCPVETNAMMIDRTSEFVHATNRN